MCGVSHSGHFVYKAAIQFLSQSADPQGLVTDYTHLKRGRPDIVKLAMSDVFDLKFIDFYRQSTGDLNYIIDAWKI